jgi:CubicO group peptidase (beta-lactamase class C family)
LTLQTKEFVMGETSALQSLLDSLRQKHGVVGATLGVLEGDKVETAASGLLNLDTRVECTADSVFQIGSIGKIFTTTLIMQLVDAGRLNLDDPVLSYLPDFRIADPAATRAMKVRQLLNHTSGIDGDFFPPDDPEGPSVSSYLRKMCLCPSLYPPGEGPVTYCNAAFVVAGRIIEVLTGEPWHRAVRLRITKPLGLTHAFADPRESLRFRCAMGHIAEGNDMEKIRVAPSTFLSLSAAPAGSVLSMSVQDLLQFARAHMANGRFGDGQSLLSEQAARRMRDDVTEIPPFTSVGATHWGLGWNAHKGQSHEMAGHDGGTLGQFTYLRTFPKRGTAFALFTNSPSLKLFEAVRAELMPRLAGASVPEEPPPEKFTPVASRYVGRYTNLATDQYVEEKGSALALRIVSKLWAPELNGTLEPYSPDVFVMRGKGLPVEGQKVSFLGDENAPSEFIRLGVRMARRAPA